MALTITHKGQVDVPPGQEGLTGAPTNCTLRVADVTLGVVTDDYSSGITLTASALSVTQVIHVLDATVRASSGTQKTPIARYDANTNKLRLYLPNVAATSAVNVALAEVTASVHLANGDIVRMTYIGA